MARAGRAHWEVLALHRLVPRELLHHEDRVGTVTNRLAIDPGDEHVGWARRWLHTSTNTWIETAGEWKPTEACEEVIHLMTLDAVDELIIEEFVLYDREYANQTWSPMRTSQLIGALKLIAHMFRIPVIEQGAYIKKPTRAQMRRRGIKHLGKSIHARDAELHLWNRILREAQ